MLLKQTIHKSKSLVRKTILNLKSFFFGGYRKLPKSLSFNSFSCRSRKLKNCKADQIYTDLYDEWEAQLDEISKRENKAVVAAAAAPNEEPAMKERRENVSDVKCKEKKKPREGKGKDSYPRSGDEGGAQALAQRMKELEVIDSGDMEQALDIEEAIHYYSRLKSPVYLDIVDKFFVDMYDELSVPHASAKITNKHASSKINNSKRRRGSFRL